MHKCLPTLLLLLFRGTAYGCSRDRHGLRGNIREPDGGVQDAWNHTHHNHTYEQTLNGLSSKNVARRTKGLTASSSYLCANQSPSNELKVKLGVAFHDWKKANEANRRNLASVQYVIDVAVHVIYEPTKGNVSLIDIQNGYIASLQKGFSGTPFSFNLLKVTYSQNASWYDCSAGNEDVFKKSLKVKGKNILNVYVCDPWSSFGQFGSYAWSSFPDEAGTVHDGIVIINPTVVDEISAYQTLVHETGHWMGLFHTFGKA
jgi:hypothetical protein